MSAASSCTPSVRAQEIIQTCVGLKDSGAVAAYLHRVSADLPIRPIPRESIDYLERYFLSCEGGVYSYLHRFVRGDGDRAVHCHPWRVASSTILTGSYKELRGRKPTGEQMPEYQVSEFHPGDENIITADDIHQIISVEAETWTCFQHTEWVSEWGFYTLLDKHRHFRFDREKGGGRNRHWWRRAPLGRDFSRFPMKEAA